MITQKTMLLKRKDLFDFFGSREGKKKGDPKNEGFSVEVYENTCRKNVRNAVWIQLLKTMEL